MKKIISSKPTLFQWSLLMVFSFTMSVVGLVCEVLESVEVTGAGFFGFAVFGSLFLLLACALNRLVCVIWFEDGVIKRKGLFGGFYKECPADAIQKVVIKYTRREGDFVYLVDDSAHQFDGVRSDSYIYFRKTKKNLEFLQTFWSGEIVEKE